MSHKDTFERRTAVRHRTFKGGKLVLNSGDAVLDCIIRNLSETGALIEIPSAATVPENFDLDANGQVRACAIGGGNLVESE